MCVCTHRIFIIIIIIFFPIVPFYCQFWSKILSWEKRFALVLLVFFFFLILALMYEHFTNTAVIDVSTRTTVSRIVGMKVSRMGTFDNITCN